MTSPSEIDTSRSDRENFDAALKAMVAEADLTGIRVTKWHAELFADEPVEVDELDFKVSSAFRYREDGFDTKFNVNVPLMSSGSSEEMANIEVEVVASFVTSGDSRPDKELLSAFIDQVAFFVVMPFIREGLHSLSVKIGLEPITVGLMQQGTGAPRTTWIGKRNYEGVEVVPELEPSEGDLQD